MFLYQLQSLRIFSVDLIQFNFATLGHMAFSSVHKSKFPLQIEDRFISFYKRALFWLTLSAKKVNEYPCPSNILKIKFDKYLYVYCTSHVLIFENDSMLASTKRHYDRVILNHDTIYCFDEILKILYYKSINDASMASIPYQKYAVNDKFICVFDRGVIRWFSLDRLKTLAIANIQDTHPFQLPSFVLNMYLCHPTFPLVLMYTYDMFYIVDIMNNIQYSQQLECPIQHHFISQNCLLYIYTNKYICVNILTMENVVLPFNVIKPEQCKSYQNDMLIISVYTTSITLYDLNTFTSVEFQINHAVKDICIFNNQVFYVDGSDKVFHIYKVNEEWGQDFIKIQDWSLTRLHLDVNKMYLGGLNEWFIYEIS